MASEGAMHNQTMVKFGYPDSVLREFAHWTVMVRPAQVTAGSLVLAAKSEATAFSALDPAAFAELSAVTGWIERQLSANIGYERINYLMLMMVDPHVHFHIFPRYEGVRCVAEMAIQDSGWPGPPDLSSATKLNAAALEAAVRALGAGDNAEPDHKPG